MSIVFVFVMLDVLAVVIIIITILLLPLQILPFLTSFFCCYFYRVKREIEELLCLFCVNNLQLTCWLHTYKRKFVKRLASQAYSKIMHIWFNIINYEYDSTWNGIQNKFAPENAPFFNASPGGMVNIQGIVNIAKPREIIYCTMEFHVKKLLFKYPEHSRRLDSQNTHSQRDKNACV